VKIEVYTKLNSFARCDTHRTSNLRSVQKYVSPINSIHHLFSSMSMPKTSFYRLVVQHILCHYALQRSQRSQHCLLILSPAELAHSLIDPRFPPNQLLSRAIMTSKENSNFFIWIEFCISWGLNHVAAMCAPFCLGGRNSDWFVALPSALPTSQGSVTGWGQI
jgi:hypothetical protein